MTERGYTFLISLGTALAWASWFVVLIFIDPEQSKFFGLTLFFSSLFLALLGSIYFLSYWLRNRIFGIELSFKNLAVSTRQAILFTVLIITTLWLQSQQLLTLYNEILLVAALTVIEFFFIIKRARRV